MLAVHDQFTRQMSDRLKTTGMGLGLVRLLQRAGRIKEARTTLSSLENAFHDVAVAPDKPSRRPSKSNRSKGVARTTYCASGPAPTRIVVPEMRPPHWSLA